MSTTHALSPYSTLVERFLDSGTLLPPDMEGSASAGYTGQYNRPQKASITVTRGTEVLLPAPEGRGSTLKVFRSSGREGWVLFSTTAEESEEGLFFRIPHPVSSSLCRDVYAFEVVPADPGTAGRSGWLAVQSRPSGR